MNSIICMIFYKINFILLLYLFPCNIFYSQNKKDTCSHYPRFQKLISLGHAYSSHYLIPMGAYYQFKKFVPHGINLNIAINYAFFYFNILSEVYPKSEFGTLFKSTFNHGFTFKIPESTIYFKLYLGINFFATGSRRYNNLYFTNDITHYNKGIQILFKIYKRWYYQMDVVSFSYHISQSIGRYKYNYNSMNIYYGILFMNSISYEF